MPPPEEPRPTVLIADDQRDLADLYAIWLRDDYGVATAYGGEEALQRYDSSVAVVVLDRRMPDIPGDEVLREIRERDPTVPVVMLSAVKPDFDILEMSFDGYLTKPVERDDLRLAIERMLARRGYDRQRRVYARLASKRRALDASHSDAELAANEDFGALNRRMADLGSEIDAAPDEFADPDADPTASVGGDS